MSSSDSEPLAKRPKFSLDPRKAELVLEKVLEVVSDVRALVALSRVNKTVRSSVYRSNGLRLIRYITTTGFCSKVCSDFCAVLNGIHIAAGPNTEEKLKQGFSWLWNVGKGLNSLKFKLNRRYDDGKAPLLQLKLLALHGENRNIRKIKLRGAAYDEVLLFICKYIGSLSDLSVEEVDLSPLSGSKLEFWKILSQCEQLHKLHIVLGEKILPGNEETPKLFQLAFKAPLRYLRIHSSGYFWIVGESDYRQIFTQTLTCENLRKNLECLTLCDDGGPGLDWFINTCYNYGYMQPFEKVIELRSSVDEFEKIRWQTCFALFPALKKIHFVSDFYPMDLDLFIRGFLRSYSCGSQETKLQIDIRTDSREIREFERVTNCRFIMCDNMPTERLITRKVVDEDDVVESIVLKRGNVTLEFRFQIEF